MTVDVLGTKYTIDTVSRDSDKLLEYNDGYCDDSVKRLCIADLHSFEDDPNSKKDLGVVTRKTIRHEIVHAFLSESGLAENSPWAQNEEIVDWIAIQGPKLYKAWQEACAL